MITIGNNSTITIEVDLSDGSTSTVTIPASAILETVQGAAPEERIPNDVEDSVVICVRNDHTNAYAGWDTTPWDSTDWDKAPNNIGRRVFFVMAGNEATAPAGLQVFATSETVISTSNRFVAASDPYTISQVDINGTPLVLGTDYNLVDLTPWVAEFPPRPDLIFAGDGVTTSFDVSAAQFGIASVRRNGSLLTDGIDYNIVGNTLSFVQPPPFITPINATTSGRHYVGDGFQTVYDVGQSALSLDESNIFAFIDGDFVPVTDYAVNSGGGDLEFDTAPPLNSEIIFFSLGNEVLDQSSRYVRTTDTGDGAATTFVIGSNANALTTWVFVDGRYQVLGVDYTIPVFGTIAFTTPPANGAVIRTRTLSPIDYIAYDQEHIVISASGAATESLPGITDADPDRILVFVDDVPLNGYSSGTVDYFYSNGNPDTITFVNPPAPGSNITIRMVRFIQIDEATTIQVLPATGDQIQVIQNPTMAPGDSVTFYYNDFPVGPLGGFTVNAAPATYDVVDGLLRIAVPVLNGFISLTYNSERRVQNPTSILVRMENIVDLALADHLSFDDPLGSEIDFRRLEIRVLNTTDGLIYVWDGTDWTDTGVVLAATDQILVLRDQQILEYDGTDFNVVFNTGDTSTTPPVLQYPLWGTGIVSGTYALGQTATASVDFPEAFQAIDHPGDCGIVESVPPPSPTI